ncbi:MAG: hypothetical protein ACYTG4_16530, partial [Planctomycetota bacterium]
MIDLDADVDQAYPCVPSGPLPGRGQLEQIQCPLFRSAVVVGLYRGLLGGGLASRRDGEVEGEVPGNVLDVGIVSESLGNGADIGSFGISEDDRALELRAGLFGPCVEPREGGSFGAARQKLPAATGMSDADAGRYRPIFIHRAYDFLGLWSVGSGGELQDELVGGAGRSWGLRVRGNGGRGQRRDERGGGDGHASRYQVHEFSSLSSRLRVSGLPRRRRPGVVTAVPSLARGCEVTIRPAAGAVNGPEG